MALDDIREAMEATGDGTPAVVVQAFAPESAIVMGVKLMPVSLGMWLVLEKIGSPCVDRSSNPSDYDFAAALFVLSRPSAESRKAIQSGTFEDQVYEFAEVIPLGSFLTGMEALNQVLEAAMSTALAMRSTHGGDQKKTVASGGG